MTLEEFSKEVEIVDRGKTWRYVWCSYFTPWYTSTASHSHYLNWFYEELKKLVEQENTTFEALKNEAENTEAEDTTANTVDGESDERAEDAGSDDSVDGSAGDAPEAGRSDDEASDPSADTESSGA